VPALRVTCPSCKTVLQVSEELEGKAARCPKCQTVLKIAGPAPALPAAPTKVPTPAKPPAAAPKRAAAPAPANDFVFERPTAPTPRRKRQASSRRFVAVGGGLLALLLLVGCAGGLYYAYSLFWPGQPRQVADAPKAPPAGRDGNKPGAKKPPPAPVSRKPLLGKWENVGDEDKGTLEFFPDGSVAVAMAGAAEAKGTYRLLGDGVLEVKLPLPGGQTVTQKLKFKVTGDELVTTDESAKVDRFKRATVAAARPPVKPAEQPGPAPTDDGKEYTSEEGRFRVRFPGTPAVADVGRSRSTWLDTPAGTFAVVCTDLTMTELAQGPKAVVDRASELMKKHYQAEDLKPIDLGGHPGAEMLLHKQKDGVPVDEAYRLYVVKGRQFELMLTMPKGTLDRAKARQFFETFRVLEGVPEPPAGSAQDRAVSLAVKRGGYARRDDKAPGRPVVEVVLNITRTTDADLKELAILKDLRQLHLNATLITAEGVKYLGGLKQLEKLDLSSNNLQGATLKELAGLSALRWLSLQGCPVEDDGVKELAALKGLQFLSLPQTLIGDEALKALAGLKNLTALELHTTGITDEGVKALARLSQLRDLDLRSTAVTDAGLKALAGLKGLKTLRLEKTKVTAAGVAGLKKALPDCKITR
jgi:predicted Zn finger-like uncharacterized protein